MLTEDLLSQLREQDAVLLSDAELINEHTDVLGVLAAPPHGRYAYLCLRRDISEIDLDQALADALAHWRTFLAHGRTSGDWRVRRDGTVQVQIHRITVPGDISTLVSGTS